MAHCERVHDDVSRDIRVHILAHIIDDTKEHIDDLETPLDRTGTEGLQNDLQS